MSALLQHHWPECFQAGLIKIVGRPATFEEINKIRQTPEAKRRHSARVNAYYHRKKNRE